MPHQTDQPTGKSQHGVFSSVMFHHAVVFLLLTHSHGGQCQENFKIMAGIGDVVTLPCRVEPATNAVDTMLEWSRPDLDPRFVHVRRSGEDRLVDQHPSYKGRTSVSIDGLKQGDMSLRLSKVSFSDQGTYRCFIPELKVESSVQLVVDAVIKISNVSSGVLKCESTGWNLAPEVSWLDADGKPLSGGSTESVKGSDGLYTVSSKVTVERKHGRSFTCRVTQKTINQTREAIIKVSDDFFPPHSGSNVGAVIGAIIGSGFILAVVYYMWKRHNDNKGKAAGEEKRQNSSGNNASEKKRLLESEVERGTVTAEKTQEKGMAHQKEDPNHPAPSGTEGETNNTASRKQSDTVEAGSQSVVEDEGQQPSQVQTTSHLDNKKEEAKSVGKANPDPTERGEASGQETQPPAGERTDHDVGAKRGKTKAAGEQILGSNEKIEDEGSPVDAALESEKANQLETNKHQDNYTPEGEGKNGDLEPNKEETTAARKEFSSSTESKDTENDIGSSVDDPLDVKEENISDKDNTDKSNQSTTDGSAAQSLNKVETPESGPAAGGGTDSKEEEKRKKSDKSNPPPRPPRTFTAPENKPANSAPQSPADESRDEDKKTNPAGNVSGDQRQPAEDTAEEKPEDKVNDVSQKPDPPSSANQDTKTAIDQEKRGDGETGTTTDKDAETAEQSSAGNDNTGVKNTEEGGTTAPSSTSVDNCTEEKSAKAKPGEKNDNDGETLTNGAENPTKGKADAQDQQQVKNENKASDNASEQPGS